LIPSILPPLPPVPQLSEFTLSAAKLVFEAENNPYRRSLLRLKAGIANTPRGAEAGTVRPGPTAPG